jgi:hypothetical protein
MHHSMTRSTIASAKRTSMHCSNTPPTNRNSSVRDRGNSTHRCRSVRNRRQTTVRAR